MMENTTDTLNGESENTMSTGKIVAGMMAVQSRLDRLAGMPYTHDEASSYLSPYDLVATALMAEIGETLQEIKGTWAWWSEKDLNVEALQEEIMDVWFFTLALMDLINTSTRDESMDAEAAGSIVAKGVEELVNLITDGEYKADYEEFLVVADPDNLSKSDLEHLVDVLMSLFQTVLRMNEMTGSAESAFEVLFTLHTGLIVLARKAGMTDEQLWRNYRAKAHVNLERWLNSGLIDRSEDLYVDTVKILDDPEYEAVPLVVYPDYAELSEDGLLSSMPSTIEDVLNGAGSVQA